MSARLFYPDLANQLRTLAEGADAMDRQRAILNTGGPNSEGT
jgi:hypothetical protein